MLRNCQPLLGYMAVSAGVISDIRMASCTASSSDRGPRIQSLPLKQLHMSPTKTIHTFGVHYFSSKQKEMDYYSILFPTTVPVITSTSSWQREKLLKPTEIFF